MFGEISQSITRNYVPSFYQLVMGILESEIHLLSFYKIIRFSSVIIIEIGD